VVWDNFQNYYSIPNPFPFHFMTFQSQTTKLVYSYTGTKTSGMETVLNTFAASYLNNEGR